MQQQQFISPFSVENIISKKTDKDSDETLNHSSGSSASYGKFFIPILLNQMGMCTAQSSPYQVIRHEERSKGSFDHNCPGC